MALADITAMLMLTPLIITAMSAFVFKEKVGWRRWSAVMVGFCGMLMVVQPGGSAAPLAAIALALLSAIGVAVRDALSTADARQYSEPRCDLDLNPGHDDRRRVADDGRAKLATARIRRSCSRYSAARVSCFWAITRS